MIKENQKVFSKILVILDILSLIAAFILAWYIRMRSGIFHLNDGYLSFRQYLLPMLIIIPIYLIIYNYVGLYEPFRIKTIYDEFVITIKGNIY